MAGKPRKLRPNEVAVVLSDGVSRGLSMLVGHKGAAQIRELRGRVGSSGSAPTAVTGSPSRWLWQRLAPHHAALIAATP
jgi:hypothetical protein